MDVISTLPQPILEIILSLLSTKEAARTSILSTEWRYKWLKIPKLKFYHRDRQQHTESTRGNMYISCDSLYHIHQVLLRHQGPIHELTLYTCNYCDCFDFDRIIRHLAKNHTVKKLALYAVSSGYGSRIDFLISMLPLHHLTDLYLWCVDLEHEGVFKGFSSLRSLVLEDVRISKETLLHLLSNCPSLKSFNLNIDDIYWSAPCTVIELCKCLHAIEHLTIYRYVSWWLDVDPVPQELPTFLNHLRYICFKEMRFDDYRCLPFLLVWIKCSPNMEKFKLEVDWVVDHDVEYSFVWEEYSDIWLEHLIELELESVSILMMEMDYVKFILEFVKFILARSPKLKTVRIQSSVFPDQVSRMFKTLLEAPRASPEIIIVA